jgi:hypothetical protein
MGSRASVIFFKFGPYTFSFDLVFEAPAVSGVSARKAMLEDRCSTPSLASDRPSADRLPSDGM